MPYRAMLLNWLTARVPRFRALEPRLFTLLSHTRSLARKTQYAAVAETVVSIVVFGTVIEESSRGKRPGNLLKKIIEMTPKKLDQAIRAADKKWLAKHVAEGVALEKEEETNLRKFIAKLKWPPATIRISCACGQTIRLPRIMTRDGAEIYQDICPNCCTLWEIHGATVSGGWNKHHSRELVPPIMRSIVWPSRHPRLGRQKAGTGTRR